MNWHGRPPRWQRMSVPTRFVMIKAMVLAFFVVLVLAPFTAWLMSLPMWAMDVFGYLLSSPYHTQGERWFRGALVLAGLPSLIAVAWRAYEDRDFDLGVTTGIAAIVLLVVLIAHYRWIEDQREGQPVGAEAAAAQRAEAELVGGTR